MEKVFRGRSPFGCGHSRSGGPAIEMVKLFQTQLEHYEKVEGVALSLEGKANQLGQMVHEHLPMAMQGLVVVPSTPVTTCARHEGRIFTYDVTAGTSRRRITPRPGRGAAMHARRSSWVGGLTWGVTRRSSWPVRRPVRGGRRGLRHRRGPDVVRGIFPMVAVVTADGYEEVPQQEVAARFAALVQQRGIGRGPGGGGL